MENKYSFIDKEESIIYVIKKLAVNKHLSDWEKGFIETAWDMTEKRIPLSEKQKQVLSDLWERY